MPYDFNKRDSSCCSSTTANFPKARGGTATTHTTTSADGTTKTTTTWMTPDGTAMRVVAKKTPGGSKTTTTFVMTPDGKTTREITRSSGDTVVPAKPAARHAAKFQDDVDDYDYDNDKSHGKKKQAPEMVDEPVTTDQRSKRLADFEERKLKEKQQKQKRRLAKPKEQEKQKQTMAHTNHIVHDDWRGWRE